LQPEERRHLHGHASRHCETEGDDGIRSNPRSWLPGIRWANDELLPEALRVLARELLRERVEIAHPLHRDQKRLIGGEPGVGQHRDVLAQMILQLRDIDRVERLPPLEIAPPLVDLFFERYRVT